MAATGSEDPCSVPGSEFKPECSGLPAFATDAPRVITNPPQSQTPRRADEKIPDGSYILIAILALFYFIPLIVARRRAAQHRTAIGIVNLAFGWTVLGWFGALIWALVDPSLKGTTVCPFCAETIKAQARVCPHCRHDLTPLTLKPVAT